MALTEEQRAELESQLGKPRPQGEGINEHMHVLYPCLDHGFVRLVDFMGDESSIVRAARVSYGKGTKSTSDDRNLIRYLLRHRHTTPLEMCEVVFHCKLPIFVARQWIRHRTASVNEYSGRYSVLSNEFYVPPPERIQAQSKTNKQGSGDELSKSSKDWIRSVIDFEGQQAYSTYEDLLDTGLSRELARIDLGLNYYTEWYWKIDLHNLLHFLSLRLDSHAQYEIRVFAEAMYTVIKAWVPNVCEAFEDYRLNAVTLSAQEVEYIKHWIKKLDRQKFKEQADEFNLGSEREKGAFVRAFNLIDGD